ncbi:hypothetical protein [Flavobacterium sp. N2820]|uniref:hypothetical protein n=1 Tax=Flavobacterium sp. N2820 TaxID=2986834 RepID=UPI0022255091|nr:hypothetical protein [Flavobacterium sp. N2820]
MIDFTLFKTRSKSKLFLFLLMLSVLYSTASSYESEVKRNVILKLENSLQNLSNPSEKKIIGRRIKFLHRKVVSKSETYTATRALNDNANTTNFQTVKQQTNDNGTEIILSLEITFGQKIKAPQLGNSVNWTISGPSGTKSGLGNALNEYVFDKPGKYEISLIDNSAAAKAHSKEESCAHEKVPSKINVTVFPIRMTFLGDELKVSSDLHKGVETTGISVSIPVVIETYGNQSLDLKYTNATTAGVGSNIIAKLKSGTTLKQGKQVLEYELSGIAEVEAYIQFNFIDINGRTQTAALKKPIQ